MRFRRKWVLAGVIALIGITVFIIHLSDQEPRFQGRSLSSWMADFAGEQSRRMTSGPAAYAMAQIGTNGIPYLLNWLEHRAGGRGDFWLIMYNRLPGRLRADWMWQRSASVRMHNVAAAFAILGATAQPAIPELTRIMNEPGSEENASEAACALAQLGGAACAPLMAALTNEHTEIRRAIIPILPFLGSNALPILPVLVEYTESKDMDLAEAAIRTLVDLRLEPDLVIGTLQRCLSDPRAPIRSGAARGLRRFGNQARPAIPTLLGLLTDSDFDTRHFATNALLKIDPESLQKFQGK